MVGAAAAHNRADAGAVDSGYHCGHPGRMPEAEMTELPERGMRLLLLGMVLLVVIGGTVDIALDAPESWWSVHVIYELFLIALGLVGAVWLWLAWFNAERVNRHLRLSLEARREERDAWRASAQRALEGLGSAVAQQFTAWSLTGAERDVALLLLKGRSHKEIARDTLRSERTVRQHAVAVYQKAGLAGRAELAAFFLEDLMLPDRRPPVTPISD